MSVVAWMLTWTWRVVLSFGSGFLPFVLGAGPQLSVLGCTGIGHRSGRHQPVLLGWPTRGRVRKHRLQPPPRHADRHRRHRRHRPPGNLATGRADRHLPGPAWPRPLVDQANGAGRCWSFVAPATLANADLLSWLRPLSCDLFAQAGPERDPADVSARAGNDGEGDV